MIGLSLIFRVIFFWASEVSVPFDDLSNNQAEIKHAVELKVQTSVHTIVPWKTRISLQLLDCSNNSHFKSGWGIVQKDPRERWRTGPCSTKWTTGSQRPHPESPFSAANCQISNCVCANASLSKVTFNLFHEGLAGMWNGGSDLWSSQWRLIK